ncbi:MAG: DUF5685 family protein [Planctomycetota bacterium]
MFAHAGRLSDREADVGALADFGRALGAWVYVFDAWQDLAEDRRRDRFNALDAACDSEPCPSIVASHLVAGVESARAALRRVDLGPATAVGRSASPSTDRRDRREAGDCDLACAGCEAVGTGCESTACCSDVCWCWTAEATERRAMRREKRARRRGLDLADTDLSGLVGAEGRAVTGILPNGRVEIDGLEFDATAESGLIATGDLVTVVGFVRGRMLVARAPQDG